MSSLQEDVFTLLLTEGRNVTRFRTEWTSKAAVLVWCILMSQRSNSLWQWTDHDRGTGGRAVGHISRVAILIQGNSVQNFPGDGVADRHHFLFLTKKGWVAIGIPLAQGHGSVTKCGDKVEMVGLHRL